MAAAEAAGAREAAIAERAGAGPKASFMGKTILLRTKWSIVKACGATAGSPDEYVAERNKIHARNSAKDGLSKQKLLRWVDQAKPECEDWEGLCDSAPEWELRGIKQMPGWWRRVLQAEDAAAGHPPRFSGKSGAGRPTDVSKFEELTKIYADLANLVKERAEMNEVVRFRSIKTTLANMIQDANTARAQEKKPAITR